MASLVPAQMLSADNTACGPPIPDGIPANGGPCLYPIPWLDKNGNHNQMPKVNVELNHIFHFKGSWHGVPGLRECARTNMATYRFFGFKASAQLEAKVRVPAIGFGFKTDAIETSKADFAVMGEEVNGKYYD